MVRRMKPKSKKILLTVGTPTFRILVRNFMRSLEELEVCLLSGCHEFGQVSQRDTGGETAAMVSIHLNTHDIPQPQAER